MRKQAGGKIINELRESMTLSKKSCPLITSASLDIELVFILHAMEAEHEVRHFANPDTAARKLVQIANGT